ncbi:MAG: FAD-dependent oxidoreductase, partial [Pseudomonadales bacterium]
YRHSETVEAGGIGWEFEKRAKEMGAAVPESQSLSYELDSEGFKLVADALVEEAGIHPMLHRQFVAPIMEDTRITGIITESKAGREAILADCVIDATGDADIAYRAGAPCVKTPIEQMQAASVMFHVAGINKQRFMDDVNQNPNTYADWSTGEWQVETSGKEDDMFSPFLKKPFEKAIQDGVIPPNLNTIAGTWGAVHDTGEMTYMN